MRILRKLNDALIEYDLPVLQIGSDGEVFFDTDVRVDVHAFEKFICEHTFYTYFLSKNERAAVLVMILLNAKRIRYGRTVERDNRSQQNHTSFFVIFRKSKNGLKKIKWN